jgi:aminoglycoside phosphotransferase family enzyme/predicted kinase
MSAAAAREQAETVEFLTRCAGAAPIETHISYVFRGEDTVWKLKKAVRLPFLDFSRLDDRRRFCERELELNAPAAPGLYRDVAPIVRRNDGSLSVGGDGTVRDWVVRMACVPKGDFLDVRAAGGGLTPALLDQVADAVAAWHMSLPPVPGVRPDMERIAQGNVPSAIEGGLPESEVAAWKNKISSVLTLLGAWRDARAEAGFVRRCHGDLHLGNLCLWRERPVLFDALEFDETLAIIDTAYDLAFLLMDLEHRVGRASANRVLNRYVARTGDAELVAGLPAFLSLRAMVRAHVQARLGHTSDAGAYLAAAARYLEPPTPVLIAIGGVPGTGKSTLARALAPLLGAAPGALVLRSDEIRKRQHGSAPEQRLPRSAYTAKKSVAVFNELMKSAEVAAQGGHAVIADATFLDLRHRAMIESTAMRSDVPFIGVWLSAPGAVLEQRIAARAGDASDATVDILRTAFRNDPGPVTWHAVDASDGAAAAEVVLTLAKAVSRSHIVF